MSTLFTMQAINLYDSIQIKSVRSLLSGKVVFSSPQEIVFQYGENSFLFVYRFGSIVFFGLSNEEIDREISKVKATLGPGVGSPTTETYQVVIGDSGNRVEFEYVELKKLTIEQLRLAAVSVAQSAGVEYFEMMTDRLLYETSRLMEKLSRVGSVPLQTRPILKIIGSIAATRQNIISNMSILDPPEETWKSKELEKLHRELQANFDIDVRFKTLDRKLTLIQDNLEILSGLVTSRRSTLLETMIVCLIILEIVLLLWRPSQ
ncbi:MAG: RMD1 family protein [Proteobacteria bacterium]|nr:RMD1 family protein [Pseudomonadota bacterium]NDC24823.1 RMD1 family protein [Pseudomonadota bacterium]NDD03414.1 RMD1 family protein [Pseudomonadota bacterium]NDG25770.1 RMD1 family protein [Pseudomonadota bacterium]